MPDYLVWSHEPWWVTKWEEVYVRSAEPSDRHDGWVSYYQTEDKRERRVRTHTKPGRYLTRYFGDSLPEKQIKFFAEWQLTGHTPEAGGFTEAEGYRLKFATTAEQIVQVYTTSRVTSCMDGTNFECDDSPVRVYGAGDLAVAYLQHEETQDIPARAICWPAKRFVSRLYPTVENWSQDGFVSAAEAHGAQQGLMSALREQGYKFAAETAERGLVGAKLLKISHPDETEAFVLPYLDGHYALLMHGDHFEIVEEGHVGSCSSDRTEGFVYFEPDEPECTCDRCGDGCDDDYSSRVFTRETRNGLHLGNAERWCEDCASDHAFRCEGSDAMFDPDHVEWVEIDDCIYCMPYLREQNAYQSTVSHEWFFPDDDPPVELANGGVCSTSEQERGLADSTHVEDARQQELSC